MRTRALSSLIRWLQNLLGGVKGSLPSLSTGGNVATLGGGGVDNIYETNYNAQVSLTKVLGKHTAKFGIEHRRYYTSLYGGFGSNVGNFSAGSAQSGTSQSYLNPGLSGYSFASWLLGEVSQASGNQYGGPASLQPYWGAYAEDSYKVTPKLTVTYGVRWDFEPPRSERFDRQYYWDENYKWSISPDAGWSWNQVLQQAGLNPSTTPTPTMDDQRYSGAARFGEYHGLIQALLAGYPRGPLFAAYRSRLSVPATHRTAGVLQHELVDHDR